MAVEYAIDTWDTPYTLPPVPRESVPPWRCHWCGSWTAQAWLIGVRQRRTPPWGDVCAVQCLDCAGWLHALRRGIHSSKHTAFLSTDREGVLDR